MDEYEFVRHIYCPVCGENIAVYADGYGGEITVHNDTPHDENDIEALDYGIQ